MSEFFIDGQQWEEWLRDQFHAKTSIMEIAEDVIKAFDKVASINGYNVISAQYQYRIALRFRHLILEYATANGLMTDDDLIVINVAATAILPSRIDEFYQQHQFYDWVMTQVDMILQAECGFSFATKGLGEKVYELYPLGTDREKTGCKLLTTYIQKIATHSSNLYRQESDRHQELLTDYKVDL